MRALLLTTLLLVVGAREASAGGFHAKTFRETLSTREVERPLLIGKGWLEGSFGLDYKNATGYWGPDGEKMDFESARWMYTTETFTLRYGFGARNEVGFSFPMHYVNLSNDKLGTDTSQLGLGDPHIFYKYELYRSHAPTTSVIVYGDYKGPAGNESPSSYLGGPNDFTSFVMTTGTPDLDLGLRAKRQFGPLAILAGAGYTRRFGGLAIYIVELETYQFNGRINPGDIVHGDAGLQLQVGPVALEVDGLARRWGATATGTGADFPTPNANLEDIPGSDGWSLDGKAGAVFNISRGFDVAAGVALPLRGEDLLFFPIEDLSPTRGTTVSGTVKLRY